MNDIAQTAEAVHPLAERFPMMTDHELAELADSIVTNGLLHPIMMDGETLIDGRNRLQACKIANVEPQFAQLNGRDPVEYILAVNVARRHLTTGQQAMAMAIAYPEPDKGGRGKKRAGSGTFPEVRHQQLSDARSLLEHEDLVGQVIAGAMKLDAARTEADKRRQAQATRAASIAKLQAEAPDLYDLFMEDRLGLSEALAALSDRKAQERERRKTAIQICEDAVYALNALAAPDFADFLSLSLAESKTFQAEFVERLSAVFSDQAALKGGYGQLSQLCKMVEKAK